MPKPISLRPDDFADDLGLIDASLEDVVAMFVDKEKNRHRLAKDNENEQEDTITSRSVPVGLLMALDGNARRLSTTRALLTRCLSHQIAEWFDSFSRIRTIEQLFNVAHDAAEEFGYPDLYDNMTPKYMFGNSAARICSFRTIRWVKNKLQKISMPLGVPVSALFICGLCYSVTRTGKGVSKGTVSKFLSPEVDRLVRCIDERSVWVCGFNDLVRQRAKTEGLG